MSKKGSIESSNTQTMDATEPGTLTHSASENSYHSNSSNDRSYQEQISNINSQNANLKTINKHLVNQEDTLKLQGGDVARHLYLQLENVSSKELTNLKRRTRSSSFSNFLSQSRRQSTASDINIPGGLRREFLINKSLQENTEPPNFLTRNFVEFLSIYGRFAGENFDDDDNEEQYEETFDEESLLLPNERRTPPTRRPRPEKKGAANVPKTFFLVFKALVGSGILFLPKAFSNGGLLFSAIMLLCFGILTFLCYIILIRSKRILNKSSFGELGFKTHGKPLRICILISILISQIGFVATYILFTAENLISFIENYLHFSANYVSTRNIVIVQCILLIPLVLIRNLAKLSIISLISSVFIVIGLIIIFYFSIMKISVEGVGDNIVYFNSSNWSMLIGVAVTSFEGIGLILPIESSMAQPEKFPMVLSISMCVITTLFMSIGVLGYSTFGDQVKSIIILNLPQGKLSVQFISLLYSLAVFLTAPLQLFPVTKILESLIFNSYLFNDNTTTARKKDDEGKLYHFSGKYSTSIKWSKNLIRAILISSICIIAYLNANNIDKFISFNGCFACIPLVYIYPPLIHLKTYKFDRQNDWKGKFFKIFDYILIIVGIVAVIYTTYQILFLI